MGKIKIMHLSDLHIGIKLMNYDLKEEQQYVFQQIIEYAKEERPDAVLIAGDIYDKSIPGPRQWNCWISLLPVSMRLCRRDGS